MRMLHVNVLVAFFVAGSAAMPTRQSGTDGDRLSRHVEYDAFHLAAHSERPNAFLAAKRSRGRGFDGSKPWWHRIWKDGSGQAHGQDASEPAPAAVFAEEADYPEGKQAVELLRFVTAYGTGIEAVVDLTPYSPLIRAASQQGNLTLYSFMDTWVNNDPGRHIVYLGNETGQCSASMLYYGNGWGLDAELLFWPAPADVKVDTRPYASVTLATGFYGSSYGIGGISTHEGNLTDSGSAVKLNEPINLVHVKSANVYSCSDGVDVQRSALLGYLAQEAHNAAALGKSKVIDAVNELADEVIEMFAREKLGHITILNQTADGGAIASYNQTELSVPIGAPVYFEEAEVYSDRILQTEKDGKIVDFWTNSSLPFYPVGKVTGAQNGIMTILLNVTCLPSNKTNGMPHFLVPSEPGVVDSVRAMVNDAKNYGLSRGAHEHNMLQERLNSTSGSETSNFMMQSLAEAAQDRVSGQPLLLRANSSKKVYKVEELGKVDLGRLPSDRTEELSLLQGTPRNMAALRASGKKSSAKKVCVVAQRRQGHVFDRDFSLPQLKADDRVLLQLAVTGHGWAATSEQCGEYCHAVYQISFDGKNAVNVTQWRDDCKDNPTGKNQRGTWFESRNGWCPGSVEPGLFVDVTQWVKGGANHANVDLAVWSSVLQGYQPYTDYGGFAMGDFAKLSIGLSLFVYSGPAVTAIREQPHAFTAAEAALRDGSSAPSALKPPDKPVSDVPPLLLQSDSQRGSVSSSSSSSSSSDSSHRVRHAAAMLKQERRRLRQARFARDLGAVTRSSFQAAAKPDVEQAEMANVAQERFDFEKRKPWYFYNSTSEKDTALLNPVRVPFFVKSLVQSNTRSLTVDVKRELLPEAWGQVALHLTLSKPPGKLDYDHWDRECSMGMLLPDRPEVALHHVKPPSIEADSLPLS